MEGLIEFGRGGAGGSVGNLLALPEPAPVPSPAPAGSVPLAIDLVDTPAPGPPAFVAGCCACCGGAAREEAPVPTP